MPNRCDDPRRRFEQQMTAPSGSGTHTQAAPKDLPSIDRLQQCAAVLPALRTARQAARPA
jgi:hypothetical protein